MKDNNELTHLFSNANVDKFSEEKVRYTFNADVMIDDPSTYSTKTFKQCLILITNKHIYVFESTKLKKYHESNESEKNYDIAKLKEKGFLRYEIDIKKDITRYKYYLLFEDPVEVFYQQ